MPKTLTTPDHLFDRTWRPGHPFRPRISRLRRWFMGICLLLLCTLIGGYGYITDSSRVREKAESYLSVILGGRVKVGSATLSIFEGLRLDDVRLLADLSGDDPDSLLFSAQAFLIQVDLKALITGRLEATRIMAVEPRVHLAEDADTGQRNYNRLRDFGSQSSMPSASAGANLKLPEIVLRNAQIQYTRHRNGTVVEKTSIAIEGQLTPVLASKVYRFSLQSRSRASEIGPIISGEMVMGTGQITASLQNLDFNTELRAMLPPEVRQWCQDHGLTGRVSIPELKFIPPISPNRTAGYRVEIELQGVTMQVQPEEWMSADEHRALQDLHSAFDALRLAGLNSRNFVDRVAELVEPVPINMRQVHGGFVFASDQTIQIKDLHGWLEEMPFKIDGQIKGYSPDAEAHIRLASSELQDIEIPAVPRYVNSLPPAVREIYDRFKPRGICRFWMKLDRESAGARPVVTGEITIVDGNFTFERFPYPLRKTTGRIILGQNPRSGEGKLRLDRLRGQGVEGGPNANSFVEVNGWIGPFGPDAEVNITVTGEQIASDPLLMAAFPPLTRKAMTIFDAPGKGEFPKFVGDFKCEVIRLPGMESHWIVETNIHLDQAAGMLAAFPYPMSGVRGDLRITDDFIELVGINMKRGDATLRIDGRVSWPKSDQPRQPGEGPTLRPNLKIAATNVPLDEDLLNALPPERSAWLRKVGAGGVFDVDGAIRPAANADDDLDYDLRIALHDGTLWPLDGMFAVTGVQGNLRLSNQRMTLSDMRGRRGDADLTARGEIAWPTGVPKVVMQAQATNLGVDQTLYRLLPESARSGWDEIRPGGTVDVALNYSGVVGGPSGGPATQPAASGGYEIIITPKNFSANPRAVPYQLDQVNGSVTILPERVILKDLSARHGDSRVRLSGTGSTGKQPVWDFNLSAENVPVDDDLKRAVPKSLEEFFQSIQFAGKMNFDFSKLRVIFPSSTGTAPVTSRPGQDISPDVEFAVRLGTDAASMDVGVPLSNVKGAVALSGSTKNGKLWALRGNIDVDSMTVAERSATRFRAEIVKPQGQDQLTIRNMQAQLAKGSMSGQIDYAFPENGPSRFAIRDLTLRNADVRELAGEPGQQIQGQISASLQLEGIVGQPASRLGRGDVSVNGDKMYRIPLLLGLLQITNLSLPDNSPFTEASTQYNIVGSKVTFERIEIRSNQMVMSGDGNLDFGTRKVRLRFVADSTTWAKFPVFGELMHSARGELLQIQVLGTLQEPKVSARAMNTFSTTVDQVLHGNEKPGGR